MVTAGSITGLVLAGGQGSRMGGADKGLQKFHGTPLALNALLRLQMQQGGLMGEYMINANRNLAAYESFGVPVWSDTLEGFSGPLAGFLIGLECCETAYLLTVPCDCPLFPMDMASRLAQALDAHGAEVAMVSAPESDGTVRPQPVFSLLRADLLDSLVRYTQGGGRKIDAWTAQHHTVLVPFDGPGDSPDAFCNANTLDELRALEAR
jgi:molybdenum cofactor guanylyltransferase